MAARSPANHPWNVRSRATRKNYSRQQLSFSRRIVSAASGTAGQLHVPRGGGSEVCQPVMLRGVA
jgi:hypothetical protein